jgi:hypothetical protein|tara:strand:- start:92 stop:277 length:186 start_codon:yes stop_codon:yes gene_type:complete
MSKPEWECPSCLYFYKYDKEDREGYIGECRRTPPSPFSGKEGAPRIFEFEFWCGRWEANID